MHDVFISYSRRDGEFVRRLHAALAALRKDVWVDWEDIPPTAEWPTEIDEGIEESDNFVFVISPDSLVSDVCARELGHAIEHRKRLVPIVFRDPDGAVVPEALASRNWTFFRSQDDFDTAFDTLAAALDTDLEWVSAHTRLLGRALEWEGKGRDSSFLLRGADLEDAERRLATRPTDREPRPTKLQLEYVFACRRAAIRRQRIVIGAALAGLAIAAALAVVAWTQRNAAVEQAKRAHSRELAAKAVAGLRVDPERSLVDAARAASTADTDEALDALRQALRTSRLRSVIAAGADVRDTDLDRDGRRVAAALGDGTVRTWDLGTGRPLVTRHLGAAPAEGVSFDREGSRLLGVSEAGVAIWPASSGAAGSPLVFDGEGKPLAAAFSPDGELVASGDFDGAVRLWHTRTGRLDTSLQPPGEPSPVTSVAFSPDGTALVAATGRQAVVWNLAARSRPRAQSFPNDVWTVMFSPDGEDVWVGDAAGAVRVWKLGTGELLELDGHEGAVSSIEFSADGRSVVTASEDETARIWDAETGRSLAELRGHDGLVLSGVFAPDGRTVVTGSDDDTIRTWAATPDPVRAELTATDGKTLRDVGYHPGGELIVTASEDRTARLWDIENGRVRHVLRHGSGDDEWVESAGFSARGDLVLTAGDDGTAKVWETRSGDLRATLGQRGDPPLYDSAFSPDGRIVAVGGASPSIRLWDWQQRRLLVTLGGFAERVDGVAFSPAGGLVAGASEDGTVRVWQVGAPTAPVAVLSGGGELTSVAFDPAGKLVAAGSSSGSTWVWDVATAKQIAVATGHSDTVTSVAFSADGRYLVTAGEDGVANVWTVPDGRLVTAARPPGDSLEGATFSPKGSSVALAGEGGVATVLDCAECRPLDQLVCLAARRVTPQVRAREADVFERCD